MGQGGATHILPWGVCVGGGGTGTPLGLGAPLGPPIEVGEGHPWGAWAPPGPCRGPRGSLPAPLHLAASPRQLRTVTGNEFLLQSDQEATIQEWARAIRGVIRRLVSAWRGGRGCPAAAPSPISIPNCPPPPTTTAPQDLENPVDVPVGWLRRGDTGDLVELSGDEDEVPRVTEGARTSGRVGGPEGEGADLRAGMTVTVTAPRACGAPRCPPHP